MNFDVVAGDRDGAAGRGADRGERERSAVAAVGVVGEQRRLGDREERVLGARGVVVDGDRRVVDAGDRDVGVAGVGQLAVGDRVVEAVVALARRGWRSGRR